MVKADKKADGIKTVIQDLKESNVTNWRKKAKDKRG